MPYARGPAHAVRRIRKKIPEVSYETPWGTTRTCEISAAIPDAAGSYPLVVFSHGGASGAPAGAYKVSDWVEVYATYGYVGVMISHTEPDAADETEAASLLGVTTTPWKSMNYFRLLDIDAVMGKMKKLDGELDSRYGVTIDRAPGYALAGHSAGSAAALTVAGATRYWDGCAGAGTGHAASLPATCYVAYSIQGEDDVDHLCAPGSWSSIDAATPVLAVSGEGDGTDAADRRVAFDSMLGTGDSKYELWLTDAGPGHTFYGHNAAGFATELTWMEDVSLAFLDHHLKGLATATTYLATGGVATDAGSGVEWTAK